MIQNIHTIEDPEKHEHISRADITPRFPLTDLGDIRDRLSHIRPIPLESRDRWHRDSELHHTGNPTDTSLLMVSLNCYSVANHSFCAL